MKSLTEKAIKKLEHASPKLLAGLAVLVVLSIYLAVQIGTETEQSVFKWHEWLIGTACIVAIYFAGYFAGKDQQKADYMREREGEYLQGEC